MTYKTFKINATFIYTGVLIVSCISLVFHGPETTGFFDTLCHWVFQPVLCIAVALSLGGGFHYFVDKFITEELVSDERVRKLLDKLDAIYAKADKKKKSVDK